MATYTNTERSRIKRKPARGSYDREAVHKILDAGYLCHVGFTVDGQSFVIPTAYGRQGEELILHGAHASRLAKVAASGSALCIAVTLIDGLVLARSAMHHSINYRSVVVFGTGRELKERAEKSAALHAFVEHVLPGRSAETRPPSEAEVDATSVIAVAIEEASAKVRSGPPIDDRKDLMLPHWAGVLPLPTAYGAPVPDPDLSAGIPVPASVLGVRV